MPLGWTMSESGDHLKYLHFPVSGIVSLIYALEDGSSSEIALVGNEGLVGISIYMGGESLSSGVCWIAHTQTRPALVAVRTAARVKRNFSLAGPQQRTFPDFVDWLSRQTPQCAHSDLGCQTFAATSTMCFDLGTQVRA